MKEDIITLILLIVGSIFIGSFICRVLFPRTIEITKEIIVYTDIKQICEEKGGEYKANINLMKYPVGNSWSMSSLLDGYCMKDNILYQYDVVEKDFVRLENIKLK